MRVRVFMFALFVSFAFAKEPSAPPPNQFEIGRHTFFDFGPPFDYYELYLIRPTVNGSSIERITLTPPGGSCMQPAKVETAATTSNESPEALLGKSNPCAIPNEKLTRELKRCKKCLVFSGANVAMQAQCGNQNRIIRANVLDKDMFDPAAKTPEHTSWTMQLLSRLDQAVGPGVMDKPVFPISDTQYALPQPTNALTDIGLGKYDALFQGAPHKPSDLYRLAQTAIPRPDINVVINSPIKADALAPPIYPPLARLARVEGTVSFKFTINKEGRTTGLKFENGHPMLRPAVAEAVEAWRFPKEVVDQRIDVKIDFKANCSSPQ